MVSRNLPKTKTYFEIVKILNKLMLLVEQTLCQLIRLSISLKFYFCCNRCLISVLLHS